MPNVTADVHEGGGGLTDGPKGYILLRRFVVDNVTGDPSEIELIAINTEGIPKRGDPHPKVGYLFCYERKTKPLSPGQVEVICTYGQVHQTLLPPSDKQKGQISVGASVHEEDTNLDRNGELLIVTYTSQDKDSNGNLTGTQTVTPQCGLAKKFTPSFSLKISRRETGAPVAKALRYVGKINSDSFAGSDTGQMLCTRIDGVSDDGGITFKVDYEFQFKPGTWAQTLAYNDPATGLPPSDVDLAAKNGMDKFDMYDEVDFNELTLI